MSQTKYHSGAGQKQLVFWDSLTAVDSIVKHLLVASTVSDTGLVLNEYPDGHESVEDIFKTLRDSLNTLESISLNKPPQQLRRKESSERFSDSFLSLKMYSDRYRGSPPDSKSSRHSYTHRHHVSLSDARTHRYAGPLPETASTTLLKNAELVGNLLKQAPFVACSTREDYRGKVPLLMKSPLCSEHETLSASLAEVEQKILTGSSFERLALDTLRSQHVDMLETARSRLECCQNGVHVTALHASQVAFALTLIDWTLFTSVDAHVDLSANVAPPSILRLQDFFNHLTSVIQYSVLEHPECTARAATINAWLKIATRLHELRNYSSLKAVVCALSTTPISRLKKSWALVSKKYTTAFQTLRTLMSEQSNFEKYREELKTSPRPSVPFIGVFLHDMTYLKSMKDHSQKITASADALLPEARVRTTSLSSLSKPVGKTEDQMCANCSQLSHFQSGPSYFTDPKYSTCNSKQHHISFRPLSKDRDPCDGPKDNYACDLFFCVHFILSQRYYSEKDIISLSLLREAKEDSSLGGSSRAKSIDFTAEDKKSRLGYMLHALVMPERRERRHSTAGEVLGQDSNAGNQVENTKQGHHRTRDHIFAETKSYLTNTLTRTSPSARNSPRLRAKTVNDSIRRDSELDSKPTPTITIRVDSVPSI